MIRVASISTRNQFGELLTNMGLVGRAVEVGTHRGEFAALLLEHWPGLLTCVDHWDSPESYAGQARFLWGGAANRQEDYDAAQRHLAPYADRVKLLKRYSLDAARQTRDHSLDFVYLDGDHERPGIDNDLSYWWPKLKPGGLLAGHDIVCPGTMEADADNWGKHIQPAVFSFAEDKRLDVWLIVEEGGLPWSYYLVKP